MKIAFPKKSGYKTKRELKRKAYRTRRKGAREAAYARDGARCRWPTCRRLLYLESDDVLLMAHAHEVHGRSVDDPTDATKIVTVCAQCHSDLHVRIGGKRKRIEGHNANAPLKFYERVRQKGQPTTWHEVGPDPIGKAA